MKTVYGNTLDVPLSGESIGPNLSNLGIFSNTLFLKL